ncbi:endothelin-converting enzyme 1-like [Montipora capricornis]|uniref:endothelin-converting enzyme 1-like n=1 Tax=Montipora capricornis TaxID=246305 RepID=UPI0035F1F294
MEAFQDSQDEEVLFGGNRSQLTKTKFLLIILSVIAFILLVLSIVFITLYSLEKSKQHVTPAEKKVAKEQKDCGTRASLIASLVVLRQLNQNVDPCTNFYEYACGGWAKENALEPGETSVDGFSLVRAKSNRILKHALENANKNYSDNEAVMKTVKFYSTCVNTSGVEAQGDFPLKKLIEEMGGWFVTGKVTPLSNMSIMQRIGKVTSELLLKPVVDVTVAIDPHDSSKRIIQFLPGDLGMSRRYYQKNTSDYIVGREVYKTYMKRVAKRLGGGNDSDAQMMKVFELETTLATLDGDAEAASIIETLRKELPSDTAAYNSDLRTTLEKISSGSKLELNNLVELVNSVFQRQGLKFKSDEKILAEPASYFVRLFDLLENKTKTDPETVVNYIIWTLINRFMRVLPQDYRDAYSDYVFTVQGNQASERSIACIAEMQDKVFGMPLGLLFVDAAFDEGSKAAVTKMTRLMKHEFIKNLDSLEWMSDKTKAKAKEKALTIQENIGYPDYIKNSKELASHFTALKVGDILFDNFVSALTFSADISHGSLRKPVDKDQWFMSPSQVNAYYAYGQNRIVFPAAILQPPFYNPRDPEYLNYGGIGIVIGHEITHGFDSAGRLYDKDGNMNNWWSLKSASGFTTRSSCLAKQYSKYEVYGRKINGNQTLNENIADNGGIKLAFDAYKTLVEREGTEGALPGLGLTEEQLFFVGFARPWCSLYKKKAALRQLATDPHTFPPYRIIGTLQNYDKFAEAFKCKSGSPMNPKKKCSLW